MKKNISIFVCSLFLAVIGCSKVDYEIDPIYEKAAITAVEFYNQNLDRADKSTSINAESATITVLLKPGEDITHLKLAVTASTGATITPSMSVGYQDFTESKSYVVTSPNGTVKNTWTIEVQEGE